MKASILNSGLYDFYEKYYRRLDGNIPFPKNGTIVIEYYQYKDVIQYSIIETDDYWHEDLIDGKLILYSDKLPDLINSYYESSFYEFTSFFDEIIITLSQEKDLKY